MYHYLQYHKAWDRGNPLLFERLKAFTENKPHKECHALLAVEEQARIWLFYRTTEDEAEYSLAYTFIATDFEVTIESGEEKIVLFGAPGAGNVFIPPIPLSSQKDPWFKTMLRKHGNFGLGFMPVTPSAIPRLEKILRLSSSELR